nr:unnamed protein product [Spirometra erinaceieuropaei]
MDNFAYLGCILSNSTKIDDEVAHRISNVSQAFDRLQNSVWNHHGLQLNTRLKVYEAVVLTTLLHEAEAWTVYSNHVKKLSCLRIILKLRWQSRIPGTEVLERTGILSIQAMLRQMQLRWSGHLVWVDNTHLPKQLFFGDVATSTRQQEQRRRYKGTLKDSLKPLQINLGTWKDLARKRPAWRREGKTSVAIYEANWIAPTKTKREA